MDIVVKMEESGLMVREGKSVPQLSGTAFAILVCAQGKLGVVYQVGSKWPDSAMEKDG